MQNVFDPDAAEGAAFPRMIRGRLNQEVQNMKAGPVRLMKVLLYILDIVLVSLFANGFWAMKSGIRLWWLLPAFLLVNLFPGYCMRRFPGFRLRMCAHGVSCLVVFVGSSLVSLMYHIVIAFYLIPDQWTIWAWSAALCILAESVLFWNGIISVYCTSVQLGIRHRVVGALCGMIPIANLFALGTIIKTVDGEVEFEMQRALLDESRRDERICATRHPILLVHGVFFRDFKYLDYWGRIPEALQKNGASIFYGNHQSAASVADSAQELTARIREIVAQTGCGKVNIIAHSKGGLDCRYALSRCGAAPYVASLTTVNTPHRGCEFADYLLGKIPQKAQQRVAAMYNGALKRLGDSRPDFMAAAYDLTAGRCAALNRATQKAPNTGGIFCQSVGSKLNRAVSGKFPLNFTYHLVKYFDGPNDGLVSEKSFPWGERYQFLTVEGKRGISHGDMIDLNRENIPGFDVREFYVQLAADLKRRGL